MPLCPQISITPITVTSSNMTVTSVVAGNVSPTYEQLSVTDAAAQQALADAAQALADAAAAQADATDAIADASAAQTAAAAAQAAASSAYDTAVLANTTANAAQATANGKNKVTYSTSTPGSTANTIGDIWFQYGTSGANAGRIIAQYTGNGGTSWTQTTVSGLVIANIDAGTITTGTLSVGVAITGTNGSFTLNAATGVLTATGVVVTGNITATTGTFTGTVIATTGTFTGTVFATTGSFTGTVTATTGSFTGTVIATTGSFTGAVYASTGTIGGTSITSTALTGGTIQTSSGSNAVILNGASNALQFKVSGSVSGNIVPLGVAGILMHYGASPDPTGTTYPKVQMSFSTALLAASSSIYVQSTTSGNSASGDFRCFNAFQVDGNATFNGLMYAPNLGTSTSATNLRVATGTIGEIQETTASSVRFKENIVDLNTVFDIEPKKLLDLPVRAFTYKADYLSENDDRFDHMLPGFIAEEVDAIYPIAADYGQGGPHSWNERFIIPGLLALIQDLYKEINALKGGN